MRELPFLDGAGALPFAKMHGLGNDVLVIDGRDRSVAVTPALARALADRHRGVGFDQLALIEEAGEPGPGEGRADLRLRFWNADGSEAGACGNATRCIAEAEMARGARDALAIRTSRGLLQARREGGRVAVNMGAPLWGWQDIPLAEPADTDALPLPGAPVATSMGNPHCTFLVPDAEGADLLALGPATERHALFPQRTNVQVVEVLAPDRLRMRVWERGAGITLASGSSSCAVVVAAARRGVAARRATVVLDGGALEVDWAEDGVWMTGPTAHVFSGSLTRAFLEGLA